jgi:16S rRNA (guanine966-N2)-methyltransferase
MSLRKISGSLKGRRIATIPGNSTRPTPDMVREAVFSMIGMEIDGCSFLELYAGTGAVGIEAISRGADYAVLVEGGQKAAETVMDNIRLCGISDRARLVKWDIEKNLNCLKNIGRKFDMVFLDPPYAINLVRKTLKNLVLSEILGNDALVIIQHSREEPVDLKGLEAFYETEKERHYGKNLVTFLRYVSENVNNG